MKIGLAGSVVISPADDTLPTFIFSKAGRYSPSLDMSGRRPSSFSVSAPTDVMILVIDASWKMASSGIGSLPALFRYPYAL